ncbi:MAG TPA: UDP-glucuronic acid decarboxylase family protein [Candidatus Xenobia bacterium]|jgi:dTDP-glucose 4,6-dehydratase
MRLLISGGAGFLGSHLCDYYHQRGWNVVCVDNLLTGSRANIAHLAGHDRFYFLPMRAEDVHPESVPDPHERLDLVLHFASAASPEHYLEWPIETLSVGSDGTRRMLELAQRHRATFVMASTSEIYGDPEVHPQTESYWGHVNSIGPRSCYDEAKRFAEAITMAFHRSHRVDTRIVRIFNTYGPRMQAGDGRVIPNFITQALAGQPITVYGSGEQTRSFCFYQDLVAGIAALAEKGGPEPVNIGNPNEFTMLELARLVIEMTESASTLEFCPLPQDDPRRRRPDITRAKQLLGWEPRISLREGLQPTIAWFSSQHPQAVEAR